MAETSGGSTENSANGGSQRKALVAWEKVLDHGELPQGRVKPVTCHRRTVCMTHFEGGYHALDNKCPHQGGPLGEGSIEKGYLRCPWHGWDFHPATGKPPGGYDDGIPTYAVEARDDGIYVGFEEERPHEKTASDVMAETMVNWGVRHVFGMVGHSNLGLADALRLQEEAGKLNFYGIRHEGAAAFAASAYGKLTGRPAACLTIAGPGATNLLTGLWDANVDRAPVLATDWSGRHAGFGTGGVPGSRSPGRLRQSGAVEPAGPAFEQTRRIDEPGLQKCDPEPWSVAPDFP